MSEVTDLVMPILQRMQGDVAEMKRKLDGVSADVKHVSERMDAFEDYFTYTMGLTQQNKADIARLGSQVRATQERIGALEER